PITRRSGLVAEGKPPMLLCQLLYQLAHRLRPAGDGAEEADFLVPAALRDGHGDRLLARVERHVGRILIHGSSPMPEALTGTTLSPLDPGMPRDEPPSRRLGTWGLKLPNRGELDHAGMRADGFRMAGHRAAAAEQAARSAAG